ncbi:hypothetical protein KDH_60600 [Dictyobacter sp. S3.2.2.5]|uniref:Glycosyltransferase 2-like domain-containing protein n=1 Tax=Dictyobacter halimunensis TaxID=3026934 RepID=A0ABQ6G367_9CHLR|nr:hypothetical protein KDH_60600 [Dictyobacter sp. S3.2.2.5]
MAVCPDSISVIICAHTEERFDYLVEAIESVKHQTVLAQEIIVVIDHNIKLLQRIKSQTSDVIIVENSGARGLADARNTGIATATSTLVAFLDDDAKASLSWLENLCAGFNDPCVIGAGGVLTPLWEGQEQTWLPAEFYWVVGCTYRGMPQTVTSIRNPIGANMVFRRKIFDEIGVFRIGLIGSRLIYCDETELCIRARQMLPGSIFLHQPQANVFHHVPAKRTTWKYFCSRCYAEGVSKAMITRMTRGNSSLTPERTYVFRTLPLGILRGLADGLLHYDFTGWARAIAIITGLFTVVVAYIISNINYYISHDKKHAIHEEVPQKLEQLFSNKAC